MKKLLLMLVVLAGCLALVGTAFAGAGSCAPPKCVPPVVKPAKCPPSIVIPEIVTRTVPSSEIIYCKGAAKCKEKLCGPCAPTIKWSGSWKTAEVGPSKTCQYQIIKKGKLIQERPVEVAMPCY